MSDRRQIKEIHHAAKEWMERRLGELHATIENLEQRHLDALALVWTAQTPAEATEFARKARNKLDASLLALWSRKKIPGKMDVRTLAMMERKAENLAEMLDEKGLEGNAESQRKRAEKLREGARQLATAPAAEPVHFKIPRKKKIGAL